MVEGGERICLGDGWAKEKLIKLRDKENFWCPYCKENVILKLGEKRVFHFSHLKGNTCEFEHENESEYHINGKIQLYQWLKKQGCNPVLEYYDSHINQRADILFHFENHRYALEYQCSNISEVTFRKRSNGYLSKGYIPLWILGGNQLNRKNMYLTSFSDFQYLFLQKTSSNLWTIPFYCSTTQTFIIHQSIQPLTIRKAFSKKKIVNLEVTTLTQLLFPKEEGNADHLRWLKELTQFKSHLIRYSGSYKNSFLITLYKNYLNLNLLPPYLGLPVINSPCIITPPIIWQTYLFIDVFLKRNAENQILFHDVYRAFLHRKKKNQIQIRNIPLNEDEEHVMLAILQYLELLVRVNFLRKVNNNTFLLKQPIEIPKTVDEQRMVEAAFYQKYSKIIF